MIRRNTWVLLILLLILVGFSIYFTNRKSQQAASATPTTTTGGVAAAKPLFASADGAPTDIAVKDTTGQSVEITRNAAGAWVLKAPTDAAADQGSAEAAATQVSSLRVLSTVQLGFDLVGLDKPTYTMTFTFSTGKHVLSVGALTPIQDGYYTSLDGGPVHIVDKQGVDALIQLLSQPPLAVTATPNAPVSTPTLAILLTETPAPTSAPATVPAATATP